jgi:Putative sensor
MNADRGLRRNPIGLALSRTLWASLWYLTAYQVVGWVLFAIALTVLIPAALLSFTLIGLPVIVAAAVVLRWCANVERARLRPFAVVTGGYREVAGTGVMAQLRARWRDSATWRDLAYLVGLFAPLVALDLTVLVIWLTFLVGITLPAWYWAPWQSVHGHNFHGYQLGYFPNGPNGHPGYGLYVDTLPKALLAAAGFLVLFLLFNYVVVATARLHASTARALLRGVNDPLREAKEVLSRPGPLQGFIQHGRS